MTPLDFRCPCGSREGQECRNTIRPGEPLPGRRFHLVRSEPSEWVKQ